MKEKLRKIPPLRHVKGLLDSWRFQMTGNGSSPRLYKISVIRKYADKFGLRLFVETGTHHGDTIWGLRDFRVHFVELDPVFYAENKVAFTPYPNINLVLGESPSFLEHLNLNEPAIYFLDAHPASPDEPSPVRDEMRIILQKWIPGSVLLIDDARWFDGTHKPYPSIQEIKSIVGPLGLNVESKGDILRIL